MLDWFDLYLGSKYPQRWNSTWIRPWRTSLSMSRMLHLELRPHHLRPRPKWSSDWWRSSHRRKRRNCSTSLKCVHAGRRRCIRTKFLWVKLDSQRKFNESEASEEVNIGYASVEVIEDGKNPFAHIKILQICSFEFDFLTSCFSKSAAFHLRMESRMAWWEG